MRHDKHGAAHQCRQDKDVQRRVGNRKRKCRIKTLRMFNLRRKDKVVDDCKQCQAYDQCIEQHLQAAPRIQMAGEPAESREGESVAAQVERVGESGIGNFAKSRLLTGRNDIADDSCREVQPEGQPD